MTVDTRPPATTPWTPRIAVQLTVLAAAAFSYVTAEVLPVGALPAIASDLQVSEALVGGLLAGYALVAAVSTIPLVRATAHWPRRRTLTLTLVWLTVSQLISALAPDFAVLVVGRLLCALTHGLMWSVIAPIGARLLPASHTGRATAAIYTGTGLALILGNPLTAAISQLWGWRVAVVALTVLAGAVTVAAWTTLPAEMATGPSRGVPAWSRRGVRNPRLTTITVLTLIGVTGHFAAYPFLTVVIRDVVGWHDTRSAWLLAAFGVAGLTAMAVLARPADRWPRVSAVGCLVALTGALGMLCWLAVGEHPPTPAALAGVAAIVAWGGASAALPPMLQVAAMRAMPEDPDGASGRYVAAFQVGIMAGALCGGLLYAVGGLGTTMAASTAVMVVVLSCVVRSRELFDVPSLTRRK